MTRPSVIGSVNFSQWKNVYASFQQCWVDSSLEGHSIELRILSNRERSSEVRVHLSKAAAVELIAAIADRLVEANNHNSPTNKRS